MVGACQRGKLCVILSETSAAYPFYTDIINL